MTSFFVASAAFLAALPSSPFLRPFRPHPNRAEKLAFAHFTSSFAHASRAFDVVAHSDDLTRKSIDRWSAVKDVVVVSLDDDDDNDADVGATTTAFEVRFLWCTI